MSRSSSALCALVLPLFSLAQGTFQQTYDWDYQGTLLGGTPKALLKVSDGYLVGGNAFGSLFGFAGALMAVPLVPTDMIVSWANGVVDIGFPPCVAVTL